MTTRVADRIDIEAVAWRLGGIWDDNWDKPRPMGEDAWFIMGTGRGIIVSVDLESEPGVEWVHASIGYQQPWRMASYSDLKMLHAAVFGDGHAYQCFVPPDEHINITGNVLHIWGRLDGQPALPNFGRYGSI